MKKFFKSLFLITLCVIMMIPSAAFAQDTDIELEDVSLSEEEINEILDPYIVDNTQTRASGLIVAYGISIKKDGNKLLIVGKTNCGAGVVKCGFTHVTVQRRKNSSYSWSQCTKFEDLYSDSTGYVLTASITPQKGYQYRVSCTHYAKKNIFSTENINNISNIVTM